MRRKPLFPPPISPATGKTKRHKGRQAYSVLTVDFNDGYYFVGSSEGGNFRHIKCAQGSCSFQFTSIPFAVGEEWFIEAGAVGDEITMKVWQVGDDEPARPQIRYRDASLDSGSFGVGAWISTGFSSPATTDGTFDDIYFTVPEPSSYILTVSAGMGLVWFFRKRPHREA